MRHHRQWTVLLGADVPDAPWEGNALLIDGPPRPASVCYAPLAAAAPFIAMATTIASAGMSIIGGMNQAASQRAQGEAAYQTALQRAQMARVQADQLNQNATAAEAASQRQAQEARRKGIIAAGRLRAVMGASGAGIDDNLIASLQGQGDYNAETALYGGTERARGMRNQADLTRWSGDAGVGMGAFDRSAMNSAADATMVGSIGKAALSFASKYGGEIPTSPRMYGSLTEAQLNDSIAGGSPYRVA